MLFRREHSSEDLKRFYPAIFAESEKETLSNKYLYIPTHKILSGLEKVGFKIVGAKQQRSRKIDSREYAKHVVYMTHNSQKDLSKVGDELPMIALTNSHNGLSSFAIDTAFFRLACSNGLLMPSNSINSARITHKKGMEQDIIEASYSVIESFPKQLEQIEQMKNIELKSEEKMLLAESASRIAFDDETLDYNKKLGNSIDAKLLRPRRSYDTKNDLWTTFNVIQENVIKGGLRIARQRDDGSRSVSRSRAVNSIDKDSKLNKELMQLALKMKELKCPA